MTRLTTLTPSYIRKKLPSFTHLFFLISRSFSIVCNATWKDESIILTGKLQSTTYPSCLNCQAIYGQGKPRLLVPTFPKSMIYSSPSGRNTRWITERHLLLLAASWLSASFLGFSLTSKRDLSGTYINLHCSGKLITLSTWAPEEVSTHRETVMYLVKCCHFIQPDLQNSFRRTNYWFFLP